MKKAGLFVVVVVFVFGWAFVLSAQEKAAKKQAEPDKKFIMNAAAGGLYEVEAGKLATQKASSEDVKKFGQRMVDDHSKANDELMQLANTKGVTPPKEIDKKHKGELDKLSKASNFDKTYMEMMVKDHEKDVSEFRKEAKDGKDPDVKAWAAKTVPTLEEHLNMAKGMTKKGGATKKGEMTKKGEPSGKGEPTKK